MMKFIAIFILSIIAFSNTSFSQSREKVSYPINGSLNYITQLEPVTFGTQLPEIRSSQVQGSLEYGFDIEKLKLAVPGIIKTQQKMVPAGKNNFKSVKTQEIDLKQLIPLLVGSIKEQQEEIERLKAEMALLKKSN